MDRWFVDKLYSFTSFPRNVGNPNQVTVNNYLSYLMFIKANNGKKPLYTSHNPYNLQTQTILYNQMVWDVDTDKPGSTLQMALDDIRTLAHYFKNYDHLISFSGMGFHFYLKFQPTLLPLNDQLRFNIHDFQTKIKAELQLQTVNLACAEPKRIIRIPGSVYVYYDKRFVITKKHCIPLDDDTVNSKNLDEILEYSYQNDLSHIQLPQGRQYNIDVLKQPVHVAQYSIESLKNDDVNFLSMPHVRFMQWLHLIFDEDMMHSLFMRPHPHHQQLVVACMMACNYHVTPTTTLSERSVYALFERLSALAQWDNRDISIQHRQIHQIFVNKYQLSQS